MSRMFHESTDENDVTISSNCHSAESYSHPQSEQEPGWPYSLGSPYGLSNSAISTIPTPSKGIVEKTRDRVLSRLGRPGAGMYFDGDLLPRADRIATDHTTERADGK